MASDSRLPKWFDAIHAEQRDRRAVEVCYYAAKDGIRARFFLYDENRNILERRKGVLLLMNRFSIIPGYPNFELVRVDGVIDLLEQSRPFRMSDSPDIWLVLAERLAEEARAAGRMETIEIGPAPGTTSTFSSCTNGDSQSIEWALVHVVDLLRACRQSQLESPRTREQPCGVFREYYQTQAMQCLEYAHEGLVASDDPQIVRAILGFAREMIPSVDPALAAVLPRVFQTRTETFVVQLRSLPSEVQLQVLDQLILALQSEASRMLDRKPELIALATSLKQEASASESTHR